MVGLKDVSFGSHRIATGELANIAVDIGLVTFWQEGEGQLE